MNDLTDADRLMLRARIKVGARCGQDFSWFRWPHAHPEPLDAAMVFQVRRQGDAWDAAADGYGFGVTGRPAGKYGNGGIYVYGVNSVELLDFNVEACEEMNDG